jgi:hypothetical protein
MYAVLKIDFLLVFVEKQYFIQNIEIMPKRLKIDIHDVHKSGLRIKFYIYI